MIAYKGISSDMTARHGNHDGEVFEVGKTYITEESKTARNGYHCCENPAHCLSYYTLNRDRFFKVEAAGSIDEDDMERIACTELTILEELDLKGFFGACMRYIVAHPARKDWARSGNDVDIARSSAKAAVIAIARGKNPCAMITSDEGFIGLIIEDTIGKIVGAKTIRVDNKNYRARRWYRLSINGSVTEVEHEI